MVETTKIQAATSGDQANTTATGEASPPAAAVASTETKLPPEPVVIEGGLSIYPVLSPLRHDGKHYSPDDPEAKLIALDPKEAKALQALGVLGEATTDAEVSASIAKPKAKAKK